MKTERPILFSGEMVRAIRAGRKTQTRRVVKNPEYMGCLTGDCPHETQSQCTAAIEHWVKHGFVIDYAGAQPRKIHSTEALPCPYGKPGDRLWVRETFCISWVDHRTGQPIPVKGSGEIGKQQIIYRADYDSDAEWHYACRDRKRRPAIFMPRWASRILLEIEKVRVEGLQDISEQDAIAEGAAEFRLVVNFRGDEKRFPLGTPLESCVTAFRRIWDAINAKRKGGIYAWKRNPWVWVIEFRRVTS